MTWEVVGDGPGSDETTQRAEVPGGWLYAIVDKSEGKFYDTYTTRAITFVPEPLPEKD